MADERNLDLIMRLRAEKNNSEGKKITDEMQKIYQSASKAVKSINEGFGSTAKSANQLRKMLELVSKSLSSIEVAAVKQEKVNSVTKETLELYTNLIKVTKQVSTMTKQLARGMIDESDSADKAASSTKRVQENLEKMSNMNQISELSNQVKDLSLRLSEASKEAKTLYSEQEKLSKKRASYEKNIAELKSLANVYFNTSNETKKLIKVSSELENSLRKIQTLTEFKGLGNFEKGVQSSKLFLKELDILAVKLKEIKGENLGATFGVSAKMITDVRKMSSEINILHSGITSMNNALNKMREADLAFNRITKSLGLVDLKIIDVINGTVELQGKSKDSLTKISSEYDVLLKKIQTIYTELTGKTTNAMTLSGLASAIKRVTDEVGVSYKKLERIQQQAIKGMEKNIVAYGQMDFKTWSDASLGPQSYINVLNKTERTLTELTTVYGQFRAAQKMMKRGTLSLAEAYEYANEVILTSSKILSVPGHKFTELAAEAQKAARMMMEFTSAVEYADSVSDDLNASIARLVVEEKQLSIAGKALGNSHIILGKQVENARAQLNEYVNTVRILSERMAIAKRGTDGAEANFDLLSKKLAEVAAKARIAQDKLDGLTTKLQQAEHKAGDANRAMSRLSAEGFANMIVSQAAWMAGFVLIFGSLDRLKSAFSQIAETQTAVARAMRTIRDETKTAAEMQDYLTDAVDRMRMKLGSSAEDVGEVLYQLGSAGLKLDESLAALDSTMDNVVGTEADMENITNLVAGLYNNFGNQIVKLDGSVRTISNTFDGYNTQLVESASLTEKFQRINDLLVRTFDAHQAEMIQIRDGLKFMAQSARAANLSLEQQLGILATLHDHLIKAGAAGRGMRVILSRIAKEAPKWKEAFNIDIDMSKPLDFMDILRQMNIQMEKNAWTVNDLNKIFTRLGLRGAEPMIVLIKYFKELNENTLDIIENSSNAAENMRKIRLDNIADQANRASVAMDVFLRKGLEPVGKVFASFIHIFNTFVSGIRYVNEALDGFLGTLLKVSGSAIAFTVIGAAILNLRTITTWLKGVIINLIALFAKFGQTAVDTSAKTYSFSKSLEVLAVSARTARVAFLDAYASTAKYTVGVTGVNAAVSRASAGINGLKAAFSSLGSVIKSTGAALLISFAIGAVLSGITLLIDRTQRFKDRLIDEIKALNGQAKAAQRSLTALQDFGSELDNVKVVSEDLNNKIRKTAEALGLAIPKYSSNEEAARLLREELNRLSKIQTEALKASVSLALIKDMELLKIKTKEASSELFNAQKVISQINSGDAGLKELNQAITDSSKVFKEATAKAQEYRNKLKSGLIDQSLISETQQYAEEQEKLAKRAEHVIKILVRKKGALSGEKIALEEVAIVEKAYSESLNKRIESGKKLTLSIGDIINQYDRLKERGYQISDILQKEIEKVKKKQKAYDADANSVDKAMRAQEKLESEINSSIASFDEYIPVLMEIANSTEEAGGSSQLLADHIAKISAEMEKITKGQSAKKFSIDVALLNSRFAALKRTDGSKAIHEINQEALKLMKEGGKAIKQVAKDIEKLKEKLQGMGKYKLSIETDEFNRKISFSSTKIDLLKKQIEFLKSVGKKESFEMSDAMQKLGNAYKELIKDTDERIKKIQAEADAAKKIAAEKMKIAADEKTSNRDRIKALEVAKKKLAEEGAKYEENKKLIQDRYETERQKILQNTKDGKMNLYQREKYLKTFDKEQKALDDLAKKQKEVNNNRIKVEEALGPATQQRVEELKILLKEAMNSMIALQDTAAKGLLLEYQSIIDAKAKVVDLRKDLEKMEGHKYTIDVDVKVNYPNGKPQTNYHGGLIKKFASGGMVPVRVTHGEGYIPPEEASKHMAALSRLNSGGTTSAVPSSIGSFVGAKGIDRISTFLPAGSYVLSQKGMEAYKRSVDNGAQKLQTGGEVKEIESSASQSSPVLEKENYGSITIVVEKGGRNKEFPVYGQPSVLRELRKELEEERLTRLN